DETWRHRGELFGQRRTYWHPGTLGRCDLEPTDHRCPLADRHAQVFRVLETVNSIRVERRGEPPRSLEPDERRRVIETLRTQKTATPATIRRALGLHRRDIREFYALNVERDEHRQINTDWFHRSIVQGVFGRERWEAMTECQRESVNKALLKFDPGIPADLERLRSGVSAWWALSAEQVENFVSAWRTRPKLERRVNLSRRAILNLMPYLREGLSVTEARQRFAEDTDSGASAVQRRRYALNTPAPSRADRRYLEKHPQDLPPPPTMANPVVRQAIHEVRRHVAAHLKATGQRPDRVVIELAREAKQTGRVRDRILRQNRQREKERQQIAQEFGMPHGHAPGVDRVLLCRQQRGICPYSGRPITERMAAEGAGLEVDHIIPLSRSQDNSLNNRVVCFREANRGKGSRTPREWVSPEEFQQIEQRMAHWAEGREFRRKWENLHREPELEDRFVNSQLTDTAYASRQVGDYLRNALFPGQAVPPQRVFFTKGRYTAMLRRDWQLHERAASDEEVTDESRRERREKDRNDHRHHAIDAVVVALTGPERLKDVARLARLHEEYHERTGHWSRHEPLPPPAPWVTVDSFRRDVLSQVLGSPSQDGPSSCTGSAPLVVAHRPVKRRLVGALHQENPHGQVEGRADLFTLRLSAEKLKPAHLRMPDGWEELTAKLDALSGRTSAQSRGVRAERAALADPPPGKTGIVRDRALRDQLRRSLQINGLNPADFTERQIGDLVKDGRLRTDAGVPIKRVVLLRVINDPVIIGRRVWDPASRRLLVDDDPRSVRVYVGGNNHHLELLEDLQTGEWSGRVVNTFEAARRLRTLGRPAIDRSAPKGMRFVMSLAEGEMIHGRRPREDGRPSGEAGFFVVAKLDKKRIEFAPHWDARRGREQDRWSKDFAGLRTLGPQSDTPIVKVRVSPLGEVEVVRDD
ncbi:MAG: type II CRISPR RNA-guided endonuclease Cas9, partial [Armatimonadia bacterium]|nr:type II CRISPR RNA-guided endonuclease Cas9 [Armatimonadia bacterium]